VRTCPVCGSRAVSGSGQEEVVDGQLVWLLRCGACETWRSFDATDDLTQRERRLLDRKLRRELRMTRLLVRLPFRGVDVERRVIARGWAGMESRGPRDAARRP
jgi:hypothetical protein